MWVKAGLMLIAAIAVGTIIYLGYNHYTGLLSRIETLSTNNAKLETAVDQQKVTIDTMATAIQEWKDHADSITTSMQRLADAQEQAAAYQRRIANVFAKHDLAKLSSAKPELVERVVNRGSDDVIRLLGEATGVAGSNGAATGRTPAPRPDAIAPAVPAEPLGSPVAGGDAEQPAEGQ